MRIRGAKTELEEAGLETEGMVESTAKLRQEIMALSGVDIMLNENTFKSTYQIMDELSQKWEGLSDIAQASIIELIAGKHQGNVVQSLMSNFDIAREALETSMNSAGSAMKEHEKWQESLEARINKLKAAWQGLSQAFMSSDFLKVVISSVTTLVDWLTKLIDTIGTLPTLLGAFAGFKILLTLFKSGGLSGGLSSFKKLTILISQLSNLKTLSPMLKILSNSFPKAAKGASLLTSALSKLLTKFLSFGSGAGGIKGFVSAFGGLIKAHPIIAGITVAVTALTAAFMHQKKEAKELAEEVEKTVSSYKDQHGELIKLKSDYDTSNEDSMISKYKELSKGVNNLGENMALTSDEYMEYQSIVNTIAEQIPSLVSGYDEQGNAILSCKGNVDQLTEAYQRLIHEQNQSILTKAGNIEKDFANTLKDAEKGSFLGIGGKVSTSSMELLEKILNGNYSESEIKNLLKSNKSSTVDGIYEALKDAGIGNMGATWSNGEVADALANQLKSDPRKIKSIVDEYYTQFNDAVDEQKTIAQAKLSEAFDVSSAITKGTDYSGISENLRNIAEQTVNSLDYDFFSNLQKQGRTVEQWTTEMLNQLNSLSAIENKQIEAGFELQTKFNGGDISYGEYVGNLKNLNETIDGLDLKGEVKEQLKLSLNTEQILTDYNALVHDLKEIGFEDTAINDFLNSLSAEEYSAAMKIIPKLDAGTTISEIQKLIDEELAEEFTFDISVEVSGIEALNTALSEARSATGLTAESIDILKGRYKDLEGYNAAALFEKTAGGIRLNNEELARLESQYESINKLDISKNLNTLIEKYNNLTEKIKTCTDAQEKESLQAEADAYANKIEELQILASQYDGLTSAFSKWQNAQSSANDGDNYNSVYDALEGIQELYNKGLVGTDDFKTAVQLMSFEDLSTASIEEHISAYTKGIPKMQRYFTEGHNGCQNFLNDISKINSEWASLNDDGSWEINFNAEDVAKELGLSVDSILLIASKLRDYGFDINLDDGSVGSLQSKIEQTEAKLRELGQSPHTVDLTIEANTENLGKIDAEIESLKTYISEVNNSSVEPNVKTAQLEDAQAKLESLIQKKTEASQPTFMSLDTSQVNASLVGALEKVQAYQNAVNNLNTLLELKEAGITVDDSEIDVAKQKIDECAKSIQSLDGDVKVSIGLEEDGSIESIKKSFEDGKVNISADTDPVLTKVEQLAETVDKIEDKDVTINVTVNGLDDVKELNKEFNLVTEVGGNIDRFTEFVEGAKQLSELDDNISSHVTANISGNVTATPEFELNNLKVFADSADGLKDVGSFTSKVTANIDGNVISTPEFELNNLKVFSDSSKELKDVGTVVSNVKADVDGNVISTPEYMINNLKTFADSAKNIDEIGSDVKAKITADIEGNVKNVPEYMIDNLKTFADSAKNIDEIGSDVKAKITADISGNVINTSEGFINNLKTFVDSADGISEIGEDVKAKITADVEGNVISTFESSIDNLKTFTDSAKDIKSIGEDTKAKVTADVEGNVINTFESNIDNLKVFIDSAKDISNIGEDTKAKVTADVDGNVISTPEYVIDNLKTFADSAKDIGSIGDISSKVTADVEGNVIDTKEYKIDNLKAYTDSAKDIKSIGTVSSKVTADVSGNVIDTKEGKLDNLKVYTDSAKDISNIGNVVSNVEANVSGNVIDTREGKLDNLKVFGESAEKVKDIGSFESDVTANISGNVTTMSENIIDNLGVFADSADKAKGIGSFTSNASANVYGNITTDDTVVTDLEHFASVVSGMQNQTVTVSVTANVDSANINSAIALLTNVANSGVFKDYSATVQVGAIIATIDDTVVQNYTVPDKEGTVTYNVDSSIVDAWKAPPKTGKITYSPVVKALTNAQKNKTGTITYKARIVGGPSPAAGTAHAAGTANSNNTSGRSFARGSWGIKGNGVALGGELGQEIVVRDGKFFTIGDHGAEFFRYKKNDIVFNATQTEALFKYGGIKGANPRGKMFASGTAHADGTAFVSGSGQFYGGGGGNSPTNSSSNKTNSNSSSTKEIEKAAEKTKEAAEEFKESIDLIEIAIDRLERTINQLDTRANSAYRSWEERNSALVEQIGKVGEEIALQEQARDKYLSEANKIDLDSGWVEKIQKGEIKIEEITDEELADKISQYQELYEKYLDCIDAITELQEAESELYKQRFDNVLAQYEGMLSIIEHEKNMLDEFVAQSEAQGWLISEKYYEALIGNEQKQIAKLEEEKSALLSELQTAMQSGTIAKGSEAW